MPTAITRLTTLFALTLALLTAPAPAQDQSPNAVLGASRQALSEIAGFSAQFKMRGEGGSMFADTMPSMSGQMFFGVHSEHGRAIHIVGEAKDQKSSPSVPIDLLLTNDRFVWTDRAKQTITETANAPGIRGNPTALTLVLLSPILADDPYARDANNAQSIELGEQEPINGILCDRVVIKRAAQSKQSARSTSDAYTDVIWWIGAEDRLPRKVSQITDAGLVKITLSFELSNLKTMAPSDEELDVARPEGFTFTSKLPKPKADPEQDAGAAPADGDAINTPATPPPDEPAAPRARLAPGYAFTPEGGSQVSNSTQEGRVTVLYFWGSWCLPCAQASPLVSALSTDYADRAVDVYGIAVREADPDQARAEFNINAFAHQLVMNAPDLASAFKVRVYPTIVVIDPHGEIVYQHGIARDLGADKLVQEARAAVQKALGGG